MPRTARVAPGGMVFHVLNRGVGRMQLFSTDRDYEVFEEIVEKALPTRPMRICSFCLMPNHWRLVLWPEHDGELGAFMQKLAITHARDWQEHRRRVGYGHVYQGHYKSSPIEADDHFYHVMRYVERNASRANLVEQADGWRWSSLWRRVHGSTAQRSLLSPWPLPRRRDWKDLVNAAETAAEVEAIRRSVTRGQPYGSDLWMKATAGKLGLQSTLRGRSRPKKARSTN